MPLNPEILKSVRDGYDIFIETGTYKGDGVIRAFNENFSDIYSIEFSDYHYNLCRKKFANYSKIHLYKGDSAAILGNILQEIDKKAVIFLDAHYCGDDVTGLSEVWIPIKDELNAIKDSGINNHAIIIDDLSVMDNSHFDLKTKKWAGAPGLDVVLDILVKINPNYEITALINENQIIAIPTTERVAEDCKGRILSRLFDTRLAEKVKIINSLRNKLKNFNIQYDEFEFRTDLNYLEDIKMKLSNKLKESNNN